MKYRWGSFTSDYQAKACAERLASAVGLTAAPMQATLMTSSYERATESADSLMGRGLLRLYGYGLLPRSMVDSKITLFIQNRLLADIVIDLSRDRRTRKMTFMNRGTSITVSFNMAKPELEELEVLREVLDSWREQGIQGSVEELLAKLKPLYQPGSIRASESGFTFGPFSVTVAMKMVETASGASCTAPIAFVFSCPTLSLSQVQRLAEPFVKDELVDATMSVAGPLQPQLSAFRNLCRTMFSGIQRPRFTVTIDRAQPSLTSMLHRQGPDEILIFSWGRIQFRLPEGPHAIQLRLAAEREIQLFVKDPLDSERKQELCARLGVEFTEAQ